MKFFAYHIGPIDYGWDHLKTIDRTLATIAAECFDGKSIDCSEVHSFEKAWSAAKAKAKSVGWEGDFRECPRVIWLPADTAFVYGFVFKQENNGNTFVISPISLPWLDRLTV